MTKPLSRVIKTSTKSGISVPATVVDLFYGRASVKLSGNGALMRRLEIVGGPVSVGQRVKVDFTTPEPTVVAVGQEGLTVEDMEDWLRKNKDMAWGSAGLTQITISLYHDGSLFSMYESSVSGLGQAIADSEAGDAIWLPEVDLEGDFTLMPETDLVGISSRQSIIRGTIYQDIGCTLENLTVIRADNSGADVEAVEVVSPTIDSDSPSKIKGCEIYGFQCGAGNATGILISGAACRLVVENTTIEGDSKSGLGYAFSGIGGSETTVLHCHYYAKTEYFHEF
jgi:hypothetical protein